MQFLSVLLLALSLASTATAFQSPAVAFRSTTSSALSMADVVAEEETTEAVKPVVAEPEAPPPSGLTMAAVRKHIDNLDASNFDSTLETLEPFFLNEAGSSFYSKSLKRIQRTATVLGKNVPEQYAFAAKCTAKKRAKQDAFIQTKEAERLEAEREAAEASAAATEALEEEEEAAAQDEPSAKE